MSNNICQLKCPENDQFNGKPIIFMKNQLY